MATVSTSVVLEYCLANATTVKVQRYQFLHIQGGNGLTRGIRRLEGILYHWGCWVRRCALLEVSEGWKETCATQGIGLGDMPCLRYQKAKLCCSSGNTMHWLLEHPSWGSLSSLCRMLQNPSWASPSSHCRMLHHVSVAAWLSVSLVYSSWPVVLCSSNLCPVLCCVKVNFVGLGRNFWPLKQVKIYNMEVMRNVCCIIFNLTSNFWGIKVVYWEIILFWFSRLWCFCYICVGLLKYQSNWPWWWDLHTLKKHFWAWRYSYYQQRISGVILLQPESCAKLWKRCCPSQKGFLLWKWDLVLVWLDCTYHR